jgi:hypothetical protein
LNFLAKDSANKVVPHHEVLKQVKKLSSKKDLEALKADNKEESKEETKEEAESSPKNAEADALPDLPKFQVIVNSSSPSATQPEDKAAD